MSDTTTLTKDLVANLVNTNLPALTTSFSTFRSEYNGLVAVSSNVSANTATVQSAVQSYVTQASDLDTKCRLVATQQSQLKQYAAELAGP